MPDIISKGVILAKLDEALNDRTHRATLLAKLREWEARFDTSSKLKMENLGQGVPVGLQYNLLTQQERYHMRYDWFKKWWPDAQKRGPNGKDGVEWVLGNALIRLIEIADSHCCSKVIDCYWVCAAQHDHACAHPQGQGVVTTPYIPEVPAVTQASRQSVAAGRAGGTPAGTARATPTRRRRTVVCSTEERVDCSITWSRAQLTFTIHTPPPGKGYYWDPITMTVPEPIVVVKWDEVNKQLLRNNPTRSAYVPQ